MNIDQITRLKFAEFQQVLNSGKWERHDLLAMKAEIANTMATIGVSIDADEINGNERGPEWREAAMRARNYERQKAALLDMKLGAQKVEQSGGWLHFRINRWVATRVNPVVWLMNEIERDPEASMGEYHRLSEQMWNDLSDSVELVED
jgi:hypothetical protein